MLELINQPRLDKAALIGTCTRLGLRFDAARLEEEIGRLPAQLWNGTGGRVGVHLAAEGLFLRGHAPAQGNLPIEDRPALALLPYVREIIETCIPAPPLRCLLARLPGGEQVAPHIDRAPYFAQTLRLHIPVTTHERALVGGLCYVMQAGELWALNNSTEHAVWNADAARSRTHLICDFLPTAALTALLAAGERGLGVRRADVDEWLASLKRPPRAG